MTTPLLQVAGLHAGYGRAEVLTGLDFELAQGQVVTLIGPNGAGKSTTLAALMGVIGARGRIVFDGQDLAGSTLEERVMLGLALVPEKRELFTTMPVQDNLILGGYRAMKLRVPNWQREIERVYELFPRLKERSQLAGTLSGSERQMLALGRADVDAQAAMLDSPAWAAPLVVRDIFSTIDRLRQQGMSIRWSSKRPPLEATMATAGNRQIVLRARRATAHDPRVIGTTSAAPSRGSRPWQRPLRVTDGRPRAATCVSVRRPDETVRAPDTRSSCNRPGAWPIGSPRARSPPTATASATWASPSGCARSSFRC
jgi:branched-chain amino acid transport system ATP-binding protein